MVRPVDARHPVTLGYRERANFDPNYIHRGIDYGCPTGTPVYATISGTVVHAAYGGGYGSAFGIHVVIYTGDVWHLYGHLSAEHVSVGQRVTTGQRIGTSGATGNVTGAHLHYAEFTEGPAAYKSDRQPQFTTHVDGPVDRMDPANYGPGQHGDHILWYGQRLEAHGFGENYTPTRDWGPADQRQTAAFQRSIPELAGDADGFPGRRTLQLLAAAPVVAPIEISKFKVTLPVGKPTEYFPVREASPWIVRNADGSYTLRANVDGATTSSSGYARCEFREMDGDDLADWDNHSGTHSLRGTTLVRRLPGGKPEIVIAQIHDADDDVVMILVRGMNIYLSVSRGKGKGSDRYLIGSYRQGVPIKWRIDATPGGIAVRIDGQVRKNIARVGSGWYFKAGLYLQANEDNGTGGGEVVVYRLKVSHS